MLSILSCGHLGFFSPPKDVRKMYLFQLTSCKSAVFEIYFYKTRHMTFPDGSCHYHHHRPCDLKVKVAQSCPTLRPHGLYSPWNSPGQTTGVGSLSLLQRIFPTQGSNPGLPHCMRILYQLSHRGRCQCGQVVVTENVHRAAALLRADLQFHLSPEP